MHTQRRVYICVKIHEHAHTYMQTNTKSINRELVNMHTQKNLRRRVESVRPATQRPGSKHVNGARVCVCMCARECVRKCVCECEWVYRRGSPFEARHPRWGNGSWRWAPLPSTACQGRWSQAPWPSIWRLRCWFSLAYRTYVQILMCINIGHVCLCTHIHRSITRVLYACTHTHMQIMRIYIYILFIYTCISMYIKIHVCISTYMFAALSLPLSVRAWTCMRLSLSLLVFVKCKWLHTNVFWQKNTHLAYLRMNSRTESSSCWSIKSWPSTSMGRSAGAHCSFSARVSIFWLSRIASPKLKGAGMPSIKSKVVNSPGSSAMAKIILCTCRNSKNRKTRQKNMAQIVNETSWKTHQNMSGRYKTEY